MNYDKLIQAEKDDLTKAEKKLKREHPRLFRKYIFFRDIANQNKNSMKMKQHVLERFKNTIYNFGFETDFSISFGNGWKTVDLYEICVSATEVEYSYNFALNAHHDKKKVVKYTKDFYIPETIDDFNKFIGRLK